MHEYSLAQDLLNEVDRVRAQHGGGRVRAIRVEMGALAGVEGELLLEAVRMLQAGQQDEGATLELVEVPVEAACQDCGSEFVVQRFHFLCPGCGNGRVEIRRGDALVLRDVTLEVRENEHE